MAWLREQMRLTVEEVLVEGMAAGAFRDDLEPDALAAVCLGVAEGCLLPPQGQGGPVSVDRLVQTLIRLAARTPAR